MLQVRKFSFKPITIVKCDPLSTNLTLPTNFEFELEALFIHTGRFPAKLRLFHQCITGILHCIILNYEAQPHYYKDSISLNSQAGQ